MNARYSKKVLEGFHEAIQSLKLYRRAELLDEAGRSLIKELYVDPLPEQHVFKTMLKPHTTILIGRKGTGKSTVFQRVQEELKSVKTATSAYIDIKSIYETSQAMPLSTTTDAQLAALPSEGIQRLLLYRSFLAAVVGEIKNQLKSRLDSSLFLKLKESLSGSLAELFEGLDDLLEQANSDDFLNVTASRQVALKDRDDTKKKKSLEGKLEAKLKASPELDISVLGSALQEFSSGQEQEFSEILLRVFNVKELLSRLKMLLNVFGISQLFLFVDDFSELPEPAMRIVVDTLLSPMNNWSDELIKLKVAAYPGRIYYGAIDKTKIDEIYLDVFKAYGTNDVNTMEDKAIDFTMRLITRRLEHYCKVDPTNFFEPELEDIWRILFYASMGNPRILGYILFFLYESQLIYGNSIGLRALRDATRRYYEEKIEAYFGMKKFLHETFNERSSIYSLKELLEQIVSRAKDLRSYRESAVMKTIEGRPPTSHFHVPVKFDSILSTLELNFFFTKYFEMSDRSGTKVSVYALNYGLCQKHAIEFGRPRHKRVYRLYFVERIFDYSHILINYIKTNQEIVCLQCGEKYDLDKLEALQFYDMRCRKCGSGTCKVINLSRKYEAMLNNISQDLLLPETELNILHALHWENRAMFAIEIAVELDCSYQLVGKRGKFLAERDLIKRDHNAQGRREFIIQPKAEQIYFSDEYDDSLDV